jgi:hypothetical protein
VTPDSRSNAIQQPEQLGSPGTRGAPSSARPKRALLSTATITRRGQIVPWLAAEGPLAYSPEAPPDRDYYFQYNRVLPGIFADNVNLRRHLYFGAGFKDHVRDVLAFWALARQGNVNRVGFCMGSIGADTVTAPLAVYRMVSPWRDEVYVFIQHGSYQIVSVAHQPRLESGDVLLYRGLQDAPVFRRRGVGTLDAVKRTIWQRYVATQAHVLSDSMRSFNSVHDRAKRAETCHLRDGSWLTNDIARQHWLEIADGGFTEAQWTDVHQSFALERWVAQNKFGPNYVVCRMPLGNIRITTCFAGEREVRVVDPNQVEVVDANGCRVEEFSD